MSFCKKCDVFMFDKYTHICTPEWLVWCIETGENITDAITIHAIDAQEAAEKYADDNDCHFDYMFLEGGEDGCVVAVCKKEDFDNGGANVYRFRVFGESVPQYTARSL